MEQIRFHSEGAVDFTWVRKCVSYLAIFNSDNNPTSKTATCWVCKAIIWRGGISVAIFNTNNHIKHLKTHDENKHDETPLPKIDETVREDIIFRLKDVQVVSFTTDI